MLLPERMFNGVWHRILHDQTAESLAREISRLPHANVTTVPFHFDEPTERDRATASSAAATPNGQGDATNGNGAKTRPSSAATRVADGLTRRSATSRGGKR